jgi:hypothetical protein
MNISQIETKLVELIKSFNQETFIYDLLLAYGFGPSLIARLKNGLLLL